MEWEKTHKEAKKILLQLENQLVELESTKVANNVHSMANLTSKLQSELDQVSLAKRELGQLVTDYKVVTESIEKRLHRLQIQQRQEHKQQLHQRAHHQNTGALLDAYGEESNRLHETQDTADELLDMIGVLTGTVKDQNQALKRIKRKVLDVVNQFELSKSLLRVIERRSRGDQILIYGGMVFVVFLIIVFWWFF